MSKVIQFTKLRFVMIVLSVLVIATGLAVTVVRGGLNLGVDFAAGLDQRVLIDEDGVEADDLREALSAVGDVLVVPIAADGPAQFTVRVGDDGSIENFQQVVGDQVIETLESEFGPGNVELLESAYVGPRFAGDLASQAAWLIAGAIALILAYIWFRFRFGYALSAIAALVHDVSFMLVFLGAFQIEVSTATVAAVLTIIGYSLNDTIVIFDRIRENETLLREAPFATVVNTSITQSLSRTLITSLTTLLAVSAIYVFATGGIQNFALALMVGVAVGTYSSVFVASPVLLQWQTSSESRRRRNEARRYGSGSGSVASTRSTSGSATASVPRADAEAIRAEVARKKAAPSGNKPRSKRKGKK